MGFVNHPVYGLVYDMDEDPRFKYRCSKCGKPMGGYRTAYDGACECGGLIEAHPDNFRQDQTTPL